MEVMAQHKSKFGIDFVENKKTLDQISIIRSKGLKNEIAGYITKLIKHEIYDKKIKQELDSLKEIDLIKTLSSSILWKIESG